MQLTQISGWRCQFYHQIRTIQIIICISKLAKLQQQIFDNDLLGWTKLIYDVQEAALWGTFVKSDLWTMLAFNQCLPWRDGDGEGGGVAEAVSCDVDDRLELLEELATWMSGRWNEGNKTSRTIVSADKIWQKFNVLPTTGVHLICYWIVDLHWSIEICDQVYKQQ